ncbi:hypothetical protein C2E23DRAFT_274240 [Lenzites betulinus]|nr:hypothetical protein C2E23DRAFT_274240 [Lenzites betulinus]
MSTADRPLPTFDELPSFKGFTGCAWEVWGKDDQLGTVNLLTDELVKEASKEIKTGKAIGLNWPINFPAKPSFQRKEPEHEILFAFGAIHDDILHINTQSGTQWDGLKHFGLIEHGLFYQGTPASFFKNGNLNISSPSDVDPDLIKYGIQNWAQHGICGRGVLLDLVKFYTEEQGKLPYNPFAAHPIPLADILACAKKQGVTFRRGDILILRVGFIKSFTEASVEERTALASRPDSFAGIEQTEDMKRFLDNHFAAIASDQPALESWPPAEGVQHLHQTLLGMWGMPIGEFFDLEGLSKHCAETGRYTFFFSSWPLNVLGGVASPPNAAAYF